MEQQMENRPGLNEKSGLFILIGLMGVGFMVGGFLSFFVWKLMTGQGMADMQLSMSNPAFANQVRVTQTLLSIFHFSFSCVAHCPDHQYKAIEVVGFFSPIILENIWHGHHHHVDHDCDCRIPLYPQ